jgi:hypothetical protein
MDLPVIRLEQPEPAEPFRPEMQQQANLERGRAQVVEQLSPGRAIEPFGGLDLHNDLFVHDKVETLRGQRLTLVENPGGVFAGYLVAPARQLALERPKVDVLEEPESEVVVGLESGTDDLVGQRLFQVVVQNACTQIPRSCACNTNPRVVWPSNAREKSRGCRGQQQGESGSECRLSRQLYRDRRISLACAGSSVEELKTTICLISLISRERSEGFQVNCCHPLCRGE